MAYSSSPSGLKSTRARNRLLAGVAGATLLGLGASLLMPLSATPAQAQLRGDGRAPASFADIVERVKPAVVSILVKGGGGTKVAGLPKGAPGGKGGQGAPGAPGAPGGQIPGMPDLPEDHPLYEFFKRFGAPGGQGGGGQGGRGFPSPEPRQAQGSGFFISADGYVVTNNHVVDNASKIEVAIDDKEKYEAELIGTDARTDLALLKVKTPGKTFPFVKFADSEPRVGDWVLAVGNPFGLGGTVTAGIVSALARDIGNGPYDFMQIDAAVNRGNSGGPTFNLNGDVVGVNTAIYSPSGGNVGIAFAVPSKLAINVINELKNKGTVSRGWLGVNIQNVTEDVAKGLGMKEPYGAIVSGVTADGPAQKSGLKEGDAIIALNGDKVADSRDLARKIASMSPTATVDVKVIREGAETVVKVGLGIFPGNDKLAKASPGKTPGAPETEQLGLTLSANKPKTPGAKAEGVVVTDVENDSEAALKGLRAGDVIVDVGGKVVSSVEEVVTGIKRAKELGRDAVLMRVRSGNETSARFVGLSFKKAG
jgi:serine protease Do